MSRTVGAPVPSLTQLVGKPFLTEADLRHLGRFIGTAAVGDLTTLRGRLVSGLQPVESSTIPPTASTRPSGPGAVPAAAVVQLLDGVISAKRSSMPPSDSFLDAILRSVEEHGTMSPSRLADDLNRSRPQVSTALRKLEEQGLIRRVPNATADRRSHVVELTRAGSVVLQGRSGGR